MEEQRKEKITDQTTVTIAELAVILGITSRRIRQLAEEGVLHTVAKNAYPLAESVQAYLRFLSARMPEDDEVKYEKAKRAADLQLKASKAKTAKLYLQELEGKMHRSEDVKAMTDDLIYAVRGSLNAMPGRLAVDVAALSTPAEVSDRIRREVHLVMQELAGYEYDPEKYAERVRQRLDWEGSADPPDDE